MIKAKTTPQIKETEENWMRPPSAKKKINAPTKLAPESITSVVLPDWPT